MTILYPANNINNNRYKQYSFPFRPAILAFIISFQLIPYSYSSEYIEFNTDILDVKDKNNFDLSEFSRPGYIMPGIYPFNIIVNKSTLPETYNIRYLSAPKNESIENNFGDESIACLTNDIVKMLGLRSEWVNKTQWMSNQECLLIESIPGMTVKGELGTGDLNITIPQAYLEYSAPNWDPPSRWENGVSGLIFDYNIITQYIDDNKSGTQKQITGSGITGFNLGAWRFRADWQAHYNSANGSSTKDWDWTQYYAYRAITEINAKLTLGEEYLRSDLFDTFRYIGVSLVSDNNMLPPNLRGYAPEISGVAQTNAKVTVSQQGRIIYETQVAPGPFRIQDLSDSANGAMDVKIEEQDGSIQEFQVNTATIPYLTRPGRIQFKLFAGRPMNILHHIEGDTFASGEFSWGVSNGWSLYGGVLSTGSDYNAMSLGVGRDLMAFGALSVDMTQSKAVFDNSNKTYQGGSYRISYSKRFEEYDSQVTFAGYRFSERDFMSMDQYLDRRYRNGNQRDTKELYTLIFNKNFLDIGLSSYFNFSQEHYWNRPTTHRYNLSLSKYFDIGNYKNIGLNLSAYRSKYEGGKNDDGMYLSLSIPFGTKANVTYNTSVNRDKNSHTVGYYERIDDSSSYRIAGGLSQSGRAKGEGYYMNYGDLATTTASASYSDNDYSSASISLQGGLTITSKGAALHRLSKLGGSRVMVDTGDAIDVPMKGYGSSVTTNYFGKAVITDINDYYKTNISVDLNNLPDDVEPLSSTKQFTITEGSIAYRHFNVLSGIKVLARISLHDGSFPPFGASVTNKDGTELGIITDNGSVYLSGVKSNQKLNVNWNGGEYQCEVQIPHLDKDIKNGLLLPCRSENTPVMGAQQKVNSDDKPFDTTKRVKMLRSYK
ncbi:outer membrane usher protein [Providencia rettgeri]